MMLRRPDVDALVVGAGIVGLAVAAELSRALRRVVVIERRSSFGLGTSSRSSEVVHAGLYYVPGSAKARLCVEGAAMIAERCARLGIALERRGKLVVAFYESEESALLELCANAEACGARDLEIWDCRRLGREEPRIEAFAALSSPRTSVVDSYDLVRSFAVEAVSRGVDVAYRHRLAALERSGDAWLASIVGPDGATFELCTPIVVNAAGLGSDAVAAMAGIDVEAAGYRLHPCKGDYFALSGRASRGLGRLLYPLPEASLRGLGVHLTVDVAGQARLGPDATHLPKAPLEAGDPEFDYRVDEGKLASFLAAGRRLLPWIEAGDLTPDRSGIRPKLSGPGEPARDFVIHHEADRGLVGLVDLIGIESPGLTAAPAIAREVVTLLVGDGLVTRQ
jgi:L-2-hydroxyglutarate oxidase LhgO